MQKPALTNTVQPGASVPDPGRRSGTLYLVHVLTHSTRTRLDARLAGLGLSAFQSTLLSVIARNEGLSSSRLSRRFHVTPQAMGETIATLERRGFIERRDDPADRKILLLLLTPAGAEVVAAAEKIVGEFERSLLDGFPREDVERMREMISAMLAKLGERPNRVALGDR